MEASISALQEKGGFEKVTVNVIPDVSGLRLNFLLEPAYYLGMIDFQGVTKTFSYTRLLQTVNLLDEDPYDPARIPPAKAALLQFLQHNGYFQAQGGRCIADRRCPPVGEYRFFRGHGKAGPHRKRYIAGS